MWMVNLTAKPFCALGMNRQCPLSRNQNGSRDVVKKRKTPLLLGIESQTFIPQLLTSLAELRIMTYGDLHWHDVGTKSLLIRLTCSNIRTDRRTCTSLGRSIHFVVKCRMDVFISRSGRKVWQLYYPHAGRFAGNSHVEIFKMFFFLSRKREFK